MLSQIISLSINLTNCLNSLTVMDYKDFVSKPKSMLIAPAGYGKTYTISECLAYTNGKQLILTHTHAGIASIKEKVKKTNPNLNNVSIETITGFAQKFVLAYCTPDEIPAPNTNEFYKFVVIRANELFKKRIIREVILASYSGLFVDEYQDCTETQHALIITLSEILPTRILGDHLQGIFEFGDDILVDLTISEKMQGFHDNQYLLTEPKRWEHHNVALGESLKIIRSSLEAKVDIDISKHPSIEVIIAPEADLFNIKKDYAKKIWSLQKERSLLIIHPDTSSINPRRKVMSAFKNSFHLIEAIDDKDFYKISTLLDNSKTENIEKSLRDICYQLFSKSQLNKWFNDKGLVNKKKLDEIALIAPVKKLLEQYKIDNSFLVISNMLREVQRLPDMSCYRTELLASLLRSLENAHNDLITVTEAMTKRRNQIRRMGRSVDGRCIGTTLLTKGLEFDTVVILNAHKFKCPKNLYVALTRAKKRLIVCTEKQILSPYKN